MGHRTVAFVCLLTLMFQGTAFAAGGDRARPGPSAAWPWTLQTATEAGFSRWLDEFRRRARRAGITSEVLDQALSGLSYDAEVVRFDRNQSEFTKTLWDYLGTAVSDTRVRNGRAALREHAELLDEIEQKYGVEKEVLVAIWGLESAYGAVRGSKPVVQSLATLAYDGRRGRFFEGQLVSALRILQDGHITPAQMKGSWAGAMGHTQFIPTSFEALSVDWTGDGRRDIWGDDPSDALASTANYLARNGWTPGLPWGVEVTLPKGFDYAQANRRVKRLPSEWARIGVVGTMGQAVEDYGKASVLVPAGHRGAAFLIFDNFRVLESYNTADAYVIGVGHLADRVGGGGPIQGTWPEGDRALSFSERKELQRLLGAAGFSTQGVDGKIGPLTVDAIRRYQRRQGLVPDGYASLWLLERLR